MGFVFWTNLLEKLKSFPFKIKSAFHYRTSISKRKIEQTWCFLPWATTDCMSACVFEKKKKKSVMALARSSDCASTIQPSHNEIENQPSEMEAKRFQTWPMRLRGLYLNLSRTNYLQAFRAAVTKASQPFGSVCKNGDPEISRMCLSLQSPYTSLTMILKLQQYCYF